jgi:hypothetical protein
MTEEERERALRLADRIIDEAERDAQAGKMADHGFWPESSVTVARALLSTSAAVRGMREALGSIKRMPGPWISGPTGTARFLAYSAVVEVIDAVLSGIETEQAQARSPSALSAPISTDTKGTTK